MMRPLVVVRPEPGNAATCARAHVAGFAAVALPLFAVVPLAWTPPDPAAYDALVLTSANAVRHGGSGLATLLALPVLAVGERTAAAARAAGFTVACVGECDAATLLAEPAAQAFARALQLAGRDRVSMVAPTIAATVTVYASEAVAVAPADLARLVGTTVLLHSARAARRLATLLDAAKVARTDVAVAAFSAAVATAAGTGWASITIADTPDDAALLGAIARAAA